MQVSREHPLGKVALCPQCANFLQHSRLNPAEQKAQLSDIRGSGSALVLRTVGKHLLTHPYGWFVVWGGPGSAKTLFLHALVAGYCRQGIQAVYYHAADLQTGLLADLRDDDKDNLSFYKRVPVLVIDELDKYHWKEWSKKQLQSLLDWRYRQMANQVTIMASNRSPDEVDSDSGPWLPEDIQSRMSDGRFRRPWPVGLAPDVGVEGNEQHGYFVPGVYFADAPDMRPLLRKR